MTAYLGTWYELYRTKDAVFNDGECNTAHYSFKDFIKRDKIRVDNSGQKKKKDGSYEDREEDKPGTATYQDAEHKDAHLKVRFSEIAPWGSYNVLYTDYVTFAIVYQCDNYLFDLERVEKIWILTRTPLNRKDMRDLSEIKRITNLSKTYIADKGIDYNFDKLMHKTEHNIEKCTYWEYPPGEEVIETEL